MQQEASAWVIFMSPTPDFLYIYNKVYPLEVGISAYMYVWDAQAVVCIYVHSTWAGLTLLILIKGQCEGLTAGIGAERNLLPRLFLYPYRNSFHSQMLMIDDQRGERLADGSRMIIVHIKYIIYKLF